MRCNQMLSGLRTVFFQNTLRWPPLEGYSVSKDAIRRLYNKMFEPEGYRYENLDLQSDVPSLSSRREGGGLSVCRFGTSSLTIEEKKPTLTVDGYIEAVTTVLSALSEEEVPPIFLQECRMQCLAQPSNAQSPLVLLASRVARVYDHIEPFGRPPAFFGVRFRFPPVILLDREEASHNTGEEPSDAQERSLEAPSSIEPAHGDASEGRRVEKRGFVTVRFETHAEDTSQLWMEVTAAYLETDPVLSLRDTERIANNIRETHTFLAQRCKQFLDQFDTGSDSDEARQE